jgi:flagellar biosynthesis protein
MSARPHEVAAATALQQKGSTGAEVLAQGRGSTAQRITEAAADHGIPVLQDFALSQALRQVPIGSRIPDPLFRSLSGLLEYLFRLDHELEQNDEH